MSLNDTDVTLGGNRAVDLHPGVANPTTSSTYAGPLKANFVTDPTDETFGAGAGPGFIGHKEAARNFSHTAGVCEGRPGIIETANIDPLKENSSKDDGWANVRASTGTGVTGLAQGAYNTAASVGSDAASMASGVAQSAYNFVAGKEKNRAAGKESSA